MVLGGLALVLSRLIDNSVVVLENIFRHMEEGEDAVTAAERGGKEVRAGSAGRHVHHCHCLLPSYLPLWRQQVSVHGVGAGSGVGSGSFLSGGHDGGAVVLREVHQDGTRTRRTPANQNTLWQVRCAASITTTTACWANTTTRCRQGACPPSGDRGHYYGQLCGESGTGSAAWRRFLSRAPTPASS